MSGRHYVPGDRSQHANIGRNHVFDRTIRAQITGVDSTNGYAIITYAGLPSGGKFATVAPLWLSVPNPIVGGPAWGRFMPQQSDVVKVAFDFDDTPRIVGFDVAAGKQGIADANAGWPQLNDLYNDAVSTGSQARNPSMRQFTPLFPGEYDFMSSGGAYIYGNKRGRLYLAGGSVSVSVIKNEMRISMSAQLTSSVSETSEFKFGQVRRLDPTDQTEKTVAIDAGGKFKEFRVKLQTATAPSASLSLAKLQLGNVVTDSGALDMSPVSNQPMRYSQKAYDISGNEVYHSAVDFLGNWDTVANTAATGWNLKFPAGNWNTQFVSVTDQRTSTTVNSTASWQLNSSAVTIQSAATSIAGPQGAPPAIHPFILSNTYSANEITFTTGISSQLAILAGAVAVLSAGVSAIGVALSAAAIPMTGIPVGGPIIAGPILAAAGVAATTVGITAGITATPVISVPPVLATTFNAGWVPNVHFSTIAKTG